MSSHEVGAAEVLKRVFISGLDPFSAFARIAARPDGFGPIVCMLLLIFAYTLENAVPLSKVYLYTAKGDLRSPSIESLDGILRVVAVNATSGLRRIGALSEEHFAALNMLSLGFGITLWLCWALGMWAALKIAEGPPVSAVLLAGYILTAEFYKHASRAILLAWYLRGVIRIEVLVAPGQVELSSLLGLVSLAFAGVGGLQTALLAHTVFFTIWSIVVATAASARGAAPMRRSIVGGLIAFLISSAAQSIVQYLLLAVF